jgi:beta-lactamase class A
MFVADDNVRAQNSVRPGQKVSIANLIEAMIAVSDNTATDVLIKLAGGPAAVSHRLRDIGVIGQRVDRSVADILRHFRGLPDVGTAISRGADRNLDFEKDPRDQSTPKAMLKLLLAIDEATALSAQSRDLLLAFMSRTRGGEARLKGLLPKGTPVAHKTGTLGGISNDVGYVTLPDGRRFAIALFTKSSTTSIHDRDRAIAEVSRTLYDFFVLKP